MQTGLVPERQSPIKARTTCRKEAVSIFLIDKMQFIQIHMHLMGARIRWDKYSIDSGKNVHNYDHVVRADSLPPISMPVCQWKIRLM